VLGLSDNDPTALPGVGDLMRVGGRAIRVIVNEGMRVTHYYGGANPDKDPNPRGTE
jgi:hypothetical protein